MSNRPEFTIAHIIEQFEVSRSTVRRGLTNGRFPNAKKDHHGRWVIPVDDILQAGFPPRKTWLHDGTAHEPDSQGTHEPGQSAQNSVDANETNGFMNQVHLEKELAHERAQVDKLKALLEAESAHVESLRMALRMIESAPTGSPESTASSPPHPDSAAAAPRDARPSAATKPRILQRLFKRY